MGAEHVLEAPADSPYNSDASRRRGLQGRADAVVLPGSAEEVAAVVRWCYAHDVPIVARGGGTGLTGGAVPTDGGVVLSRWSACGACASSSRRCGGCSRRRA